MSVDNEPTTKFVSGPVICFRLEGKINGINKVIYLFGDIHMPVGNESQCPSWTSDSFVRYFSKTIKKTNKNNKYDLFFEIGKTHWTNNVSIKERYIDEVAKYFGSTLNIIENETTNSTKLAKSSKSTEIKDQNVKNVKRENLGSKTEPNLRLHHVDVRELFRQHTMANNLFYDITDMFYQIKSNNDATEYVLHKMENLINSFVVAVLNETYLFTKRGEDINETELKKVKKYLGDESYEKFKNVSDKINYIYNNKNVQNILLNDVFLSKQIKDDVNKLITCCEKFLKNIKNLVDFWDKRHNILTDYNGMCLYGIPDNEKIKMTLPIIENFNEMNGHKLNIYVSIMDLYALRRMLDKNYIDHIIVYTGALHTCNYLLTLVKYFDFRVTHCTNKNYTLSELHKNINESTNGEELFCKCMTSYLFQCIDMSDFPENFD